MSYTGFITENIAPYSAEKIGVYDSDGNKVGVISLGGFKPSYGERLYRFGLLSDVHNQSDQTDENTEDFQRALAYFNEKESVWATCICGDISKNGTVSEFQIYQNNVNEKSPNTEVYTTTGNHDCGSWTSETGLDLDSWNTYTGNHGRCFEITKNNDKFLFFGMQYYNLGDSGIPYLDADIDWLEEKLEEYRNQRVFVFTHLFFPDRAGNYKKIYTSVNYLGGDQLTRIQALCDRYKNSIWFSGHSHWKWYLQEGEEKANIYKNNCGWCVHVPSCACPRDKSGTNSSVINDLESEGAIVDVYENYIDIRGIDLKNQKYLPIAQYRLDTTLVNIDAKPITTYDITNNLTNCTNSNSATSIEENISYNATITANTGYELSSVTVTMSETDITSSCYSNGVISISNVTGNITVTATATKTASNYTVTNNLINCTTSNSNTSIEENTSYTATLSCNDSYNDMIVTVIMGEIDITNDVYAYGVISISNVTGNITVTATARVVNKIITLDEIISNYTPTMTNASFDSSSKTLTINAKGGAMLYPEFTLPTSIQKNVSVYAKWDSCVISGGNTVVNKIGICITANTSIPVEDYQDYSNEIELLNKSAGLGIANDVAITKLNKFIVKASSGYTGTVPVTIKINNFRIYTK